MEVVIFAAFAFAVNKTVTVIKALFAKDRRTAVTMLIVWAVGIAALNLAAHAKLTEAYIVPGLSVPLGSLDTASLFLLGWLAGSSGSFAFSFTQAIDGTQSAREPSLPITPPPPPAGP